MDIMDKLQVVAEVGKTPREKQTLINVSEVFYVWDVLVMKLDIQETIQILENFIQDNDLKIIKEQVMKGIQTGIDDMEKLMGEYSIPFPVRPPVGSISTMTLEDITDKHIYQSFFDAVQAFFPLLAGGFMTSTTPKIRKGFKEHLLDTIELHEVVVEYGKLKGFLDQPPAYRA